MRDRVDERRRLRPGDDARPEDVRVGLAAGERLREHSLDLRLVRGVGKRSVPSAATSSVRNPSASAGNPYAGTDEE